MKRRWILILLGLVAVVAAQAPAGQMNQDMIRKVENGLLHEIMVGSKSPLNLGERLKSLKVQGLSIAVVNDFKLQWAKGYGIRDLQTGKPVTEDTLFQAASISKSISAVVALRHVQNGILDLDKDVNDYLRRWKVPDNEFTKVEKVTLRRLLSHTADLTVSGFQGYAEGEAVPTILQVLDGLPPANNVPVRVNRVPGSGYRYSGGGYTILQLLLEDVTGRSFPELAAEYVFKPVGMTHSTFCLCSAGSALADQASMGHGGDGVDFKGHSFLQGGSACCELWTTPSDLARFIIAIQRALRGESGSILSYELARAMMTPEKDGPVGLGLFVKRYGQAIYFNHDGGNPGFTSRIIGHPERGFGLVIMINNDYAYTLFSELTLAVAGSYGWEGIKPTYFKDSAALVEEFRRKRKEAPDNPDYSEESLNQRGFSLMGSGYPDAAIRMFHLNLEFNPQSANCCNSLAEAYERQGDRANALKYYRQAIELSNRFPEKNKGYERLRAATAEKIRKLENEKRQ